MRAAAQDFLAPSFLTHRRPSSASPPYRPYHQPDRDAVFDVADDVHFGNDIGADPAFIDDRQAKHPIASQSRAPAPRRRRPEKRWSLPCDSIAFSDAASNTGVA